MNNTQFETKYYPKYKSVIAAIARKFAGADMDLFEDLQSAGMIGLLEADLRRPYKNEDAFLRNVIRNRMVDHLRWLDPERYDRLDKHLAQGAQVVKDPQSQEILLIRADSRQQARDLDRAGAIRKHSGCFGMVSGEEDYDG